MKEKTTERGSQGTARYSITSVTKITLNPRLLNPVYAFAQSTSYTFNNKTQTETSTESGGPEKYWNWEEGVFLGMRKMFTSLRGDQEVTYHFSHAFKILFFMQSLQNHPPSICHGSGWPASIAWLKRVPWVVRNCPLQAFMYIQNLCQGLWSRFRLWEVGSWKAGRLCGWPTLMIWKRPPAVTEVWGHATHRSSGGKLVSVPFCMSGAQPSSQ